MIRPAFTELLVFLIPFAVYAVFLFSTRSGVLVQASWPVHVVAKLVLGSLLLVIVSFVLLAHFSGASPNSKRCGGREPLSAIHPFCSSPIRFSRPWREVPRLWAA